MSRLQAGGLALIVGGLENNLGKVVTLIKYVGEVDNPYMHTKRCWLIEGDDLVGRKPNGIIIPVKKVNTSECYLMPLGDKQTQDEFKKELEAI